jgi:hypothetical protein
VIGCLETPFVAAAGALNGPPGRFPEEHRGRGRSTTFRNGSEMSGTFLFPKICILMQHLRFQCVREVQLHPIVYRAFPIALLLPQ